MYYFITFWHSKAKNFKKRSLWVLWLDLPIMCSQVYWQVQVLVPSQVLKCAILLELNSRSLHCKEVKYFYQLLLLFFCRPKRTYPLSTFTYDSIENYIYRNEYFHVPKWTSLVQVHKITIFELIFGGITLYPKPLRGLKYRYVDW